MPAVTTHTGIANLALSMIGAGPISPANVPLDSGTSTQAQVCAKWYATALNESLGAHPWNFAMKRVRLQPAWVQLAVMSGTTRALSNNGSGLIRVSSTAHGLSTGQRIVLSGSQGIPGADGTWYVTWISADTFDLQGSLFTDPNPSDGLPPHVNGTGRWQQVPVFDWSYQFPLPVDCLRVCNVNGLEGGEEDSTPYAIEGRTILSNDETLNLLYVRKMSLATADEVTEISAWPDDFKTAFALLLGSYIAQELMGPAGKAGELRQQYESLISPKVRGRDARQGKGRRIPLSHDSDVVRARAGAGLHA